MIESNASFSDVSKHFVHSLEEGHKREFSENPRPGQIWLVNNEVSYPNGQKIVLEPDTERPNMVVLLMVPEDFAKNPHAVAQVFPVSWSWPLASAYDLAFTEENSPLDGPFMVECWNPRPVFRMNLLEAVAALDESALQDIAYLANCDLEGENPNPSEIKSSGYVGSTIESSADPRIRFQQEEFNHTDFLSDPVST